MKIVDDNGVALPWDGKAFGELLVRGPWILNNYFRNEKNDMAYEKTRMDLTGFRQVMLRSIRRASCKSLMKPKDVIKTGGEWISSIDLENTAVSHPDVIEAAVIARCTFQNGTKRPLLIAVKKQGATVSKKELIDFFKDKVAKWWFKMMWFLLKNYLIQQQVNFINSERILLLYKLPIS